MTKKILNLVGAKVLSDKEQKQITGGKFPCDENKSCSYLGIFWACQGSTCVYGR